MTDPNPFAEAFRDYDLNPAIHPMAASHGYRGHMVTMDGRDLVDLNSAWGANLLGYGYAPVSRAVCTQALLHAGLGVPDAGYHLLVDLLRAHVPCAEEVRFGKNGSDVTAAAVRLARAVTGRERVLYRGYHGFHDWFVASTGARGIPRALQELVAPLPELTVEALQAELDRHPGEIACIIANPLVWPMPSADEVRAVIDRAHAAGALVIFDEMMTGFRVATAGMQEVWGAVPDLACFGKAMANGLPMAALVGRREWMRHVGSINYGMTFEGESVSIAAAVATIGEVVERDVPGALAAKGASARAAWERLSRTHGVAGGLFGPDACPHMVVPDQGGVPGRALRWLIVQELMRHGVLTLGSFIWCYSHDDADLHQVMEAVDQALAVAAQAIERGTVEGVLHERIRRTMDGITAPASWRRTEDDGTPDAPDPSPSAQAERLLRSAVAILKTGDTASGLRLVRGALALEPGIDVAVDGPGWPEAVQGALREAQSPATLSALANVALQLGDRAGAAGLFEGYLRLAPDAADREGVTKTIAWLRG